MADARANRFGLWRGLNKRCRVTDIFQASCSERCRIRPLCCGRNKPILVIEKTVLRIWVESSPNPRSEMPQFEQAGFLTYSRIKNLPDLVMDWGSGMSLSFDTLSGNYSSGTVRDFHPIPFSSAGLKGLSHRPGRTKRCKVIKKISISRSFHWFISRKGHLNDNKWPFTCFAGRIAVPL